MKFTLSWLKQHLETDATLDEITATLTRIGLEVEEVIDPAASLAPFTVAEVLEAQQHPDADRLRVCKVKTKDGVVQVVCGAPNAKKGLIGVFAAPGTYIPGIDLTLKPAKIRGVESQGMLLSERELQLSDEHEGIIELEKGKVGEAAARALGLDDPVIDIAITPNRPDCLGVRGVARDLAAAGLGKLKDDTVKPVEGRFANPVPVKLEFAKGKESACPAFAGRTVKGVKNGPSPAWLQQRLKAIGLRPINALVDITNYISYDRGRPLHVYDTDKLTGAIRARLGRKGESFLALDGKTYEVDETMCVIADDAKVLGLGGIMGGEETGCTEATKNVFIESAYFDPVRTAQTGRRNAILSDARYRFERGVDPAFVVPGIEMATRLVLDLCGDEPGTVEVAGKPPEGDRIFSFNAAEVKRLTGLELAQSEIKAILAGLGFWLSGRGPEFKVSVPSWRPDVSGPADLVEEVTRIVGVDSVKPVPMPGLDRVAVPVMTTRQKRVRLARRVLAGRGLVEAITWSFLPRAQAGLFGGGQVALELANPISADMSSMRPGLLPGLATAAKRNADRGFADVALFEVGQAYRGDAPEDQYVAASGVRAGAAGLSGAGRHWSAPAQAVDVYDAKADALAVLAAFGFEETKLQVVQGGPDWFHPGKCGTLQLGPKAVLAHFGELHPATLKALDADGPMAAFEIYLDAVPAPRKASRSRPALEAADLQAVRRDFAFLLDASVPAGDVLRAARGADKALIADATVFDVFTGKGVPEGKKSLAIEVTLQPRDATLTDAEIEAVAAKVVAAVVKATKGELRG
ncbi:MAG: phenylalanine--tRNA ligase subunit beta [Pseudomonadota bacterium]|nr:phenylalanine--tRNA ligase subunit beta [Pseudomonadota bacterium]